MQFTYITDQQIPTVTLLYLTHEMSFAITESSRSNVDSGYWSILVNHINIEIDSDGRFLYIWGLSPYQSWKQGSIAPPSAVPGQVVSSIEHEEPPGVSFRLTQPYAWPVICNPQNGWICIGSLDTDDIAAIEFATGLIAILKGTELTAIWARIVNADVVATALRGTSVNSGK